MNNLKRLLSHLKPYKNNVVLSIICNVLLSVFTVISIPLIIPFFQILFDRVDPSTVKPHGYDIAEWLEYYFSQLIMETGKPTALLVVCGLLVTVFFLKNLFRYLALFFMAPVRNGIVRDIRSLLFSKYLHLPLSFYFEERKGDLISRLTTDVQEIEWSILNVIEAIFKSPLIMIGSIALMIYISPSLTWFVFVLIIFTAFIIGTIGKTLKRSSNIAQEKIGEMTSLLEETLGGMKVVKAFGAENYQKNKFERVNDGYRDMITKILWRRDLSSPLTEFLGIVVVSTLLWYGSTLVFQESLAPESFFAFIFAFYQVIEPAKSFSSAYYNIQKGLAAMERVDRLVGIPEEKIHHYGEEKKDSLEDKIVFSNISFRYNEEGPKVLDNINFEIKKGEKIALVGSSGSGKTTLVDILMGLYPLHKGNITIDGISINDLSKASFHQLFGLVTQSPILFHDTIANNIKFGKEDALEEQVIESAKIAYAHHFISNLSNGYHTNIGDAGVKLSGGQRQRLTIARAVLRNPPILLLDEATSALDSESEKLIQKALEQILENRTAIIIAHRLSTIKNVDKIIVLKDGKIIETGNHSDLINQDGDYKKFVEMQTFAD